MSVATVLQRARTSGKCPPMLIADDRVLLEQQADGFEDAVIQVMDASGTHARTHAFFSSHFRVLVDEESLALMI
jgi:stress-induced morphogen